MKLHRLIRTMPAWPLLILGATCLLLPLVMLVVVATQTGDGIGIDNFVQVVTNPLDLAVIGNSLQFAAWQMVLCVVLGTPLALRPPLKIVSGTGDSHVDNQRRLKLWRPGPGVRFPHPHRL